MRVDRQTLAAHRAALLGAAGRLFRTRGFATVSVAEVSQAAGLTHGAFYGHYPSKDALAEAACRRSCEDGAARWRGRAARASDGDRIRAIIDGYLTVAHRDEPADEWCSLPALGAEAVRGSPGLQRAMADGTEALLAVLIDEIARLRPSLDAHARREHAAGILAVMTGGILISRALRPDMSQSDAALAAARQAAYRLIPQTQTPEA